MLDGRNSKPSSNSLNSGSDCITADSPIAIVERIQFALQIASFALVQSRRNDEKHSKSCGDQKNSESTGSLLTHWSGPIEQNTIAHGITQQHCENAGHEGHKVPSPDGVQQVSLAFQRRPVEVYRRV